MYTHTTQTILKTVIVHAYDSLCARVAFVVVKIFIKKFINIYYTYIARLSRVRFINLEKFGKGYQVDVTSKRKLQAHGNNYIMH